MTALVAQWEGERRVIDGEAALEDTVAAVRSRGEPTMLFLEREHGPTLVVGLGAPESVLTFVERGGRSFHTVGDVSRKGSVQFWSRGQLDDYDTSMAIPESLAIEAAREFAATGTRPSRVSWEADW